LTGVIGLALSRPRGSRQNVPLNGDKDITPPPTCVESNYLQWTSVLAGDDIAHEGAAIGGFRIRLNDHTAEGTKVAMNEMQIGIVLRLGDEGKHRTTPHIRSNFSIYLIRRERLLESRFRSA